NSNIYYPLEGYIFPDTYNIKKTATIKEVIETMLDEMETKLEPYKTDISTSNKSVHSLLTLASMVELEAVSAEDRKVLAGVFTNRLTLGMTLGSDVTTYYAVQKDMTDDLTLSDLATCNGYNTRGTCVPGLPVGPIASPSLSSIQAAVNPDSTDYLYFVADKNSKLYFAKTLDEHNNNIAYLKSHDLWLS
ncbi:MAG TPA: endolytic transglycosylase MltG, partial [Bacilli bacterium]|nr:endolytic transglycosylase MltG [Bacilli bacterium]